jgi:glycosyltransferase involved in cell wall biosynthesis
MNIVHVTQYFLPWLGYQEFYLAREQLRVGHDVHVIASNLRWPEFGYSALRERGEPWEMSVGSAIEYGVPITRLSVRAAIQGRLVLRGLWRGIAGLRPDVVHAHGYLLPTTLELAHLRRTRRGAFRLLVDEHQLPHQANNGLAHRLERKVVALAARIYVLPQVDRLVAVAEGARDWLSREYGCPPKLITLIPLGADTELFRPDAAAGLEVRSDLGIAAERRVILYSGKISKEKRVDLLVRATSLLPAEWSTVLIIVGDAEARTRTHLQVLGAEFGVDVRMVRGVEPSVLSHYFNAADVCVWPADATVSHLEAAACGKPIVIPQEPGLSDRISAGNGIGVPVGDVAALTGVLHRLLDDASLRDRMGRAGRLLVESQYSWPSVARRFDDLYRSMLDSGRIDG